MPINLFSRHRNAPVQETGDPEPGDSDSNDPYDTLPRVFGGIRRHLRFPAKETGQVRRKIVAGTVTAVTRFGEFPAVERWMDGKGARISRAADRKPDSFQDTCG
jgi:hypothetical protein